MDLDRLLKADKQEKLEEFQKLERIKQEMEWQTEEQPTSTSEKETGRHRREAEIAQSPTLDRDPKGDKYDEHLKRGLTRRLMEDYRLEKILGEEGQGIIKWYLEDRFGFDHAI